MMFHFPSVPLQFPFGFPLVMRVFYKFLKSDCWNLPRKAPENPSRSGPKPFPTRPPPKAPKWPLGHKRLNDENFLRFSFGSPSVPRIWKFCVCWRSRFALQNEPENLKATMALAADRNLYGTWRAATRRLRRHESPDKYLKI